MQFVVPGFTFDRVSPLTEKLRAADQDLELGEAKASFTGEAICCGRSR